MCRVCKVFPDILKLNLTETAKFHMHSAILEQGGGTEPACVRSGLWAWQWQDLTDQPFCDITTQKQNLQGYTNKKFILFLLN